jgi:membrane-bound lytic murein transglycosylase B
VKSRGDFGRIGRRIDSRGNSQSHAALFASIQQRYGVPPGPLLASWGLETALESQRGNQNTLSAVATLAYLKARAENEAAINGGSPTPT